MEKKVLDTLKKYNMVEPGDDILVGFSGGADSVALLYFLVKLRQDQDFRLSAFHINHSLRGQESDFDAEFCVSFCEKVGVDISVCKIEPPKSEEAARDARYRIFRSKNPDKIAIAHNKNDTAETVLLQLFRGSARALGISAVNGNIIRPLIDISKEEILAYCMKNKLDFRLDSSNNETLYSRNKIRNDIIPIASKINPQAIESLARFAKISSSENAFLDKIASEHFNNIYQDGVLDIEGLLAVDEVLAYRVLRMAIFSLKGSLQDIYMSHILSVFKLCRGLSGRRVSLPQGIVARREFGKIILGYESFAASSFEYELAHGETLHIAETDQYFALDAEPIKGACSICLNLGYIAKINIRTRKPGDTIYFKQIGTKKLKDYFIDKKIPQSERDSIVLVAVGSEIICIPGGAINSKYEAEQGEGIVLQFW